MRLNFDIPDKPISRINLNATCTCPRPTRRAPSPIRAETTDRSVNQNINGALRMRLRASQPIGVAFVPTSHGLAPNDFSSKDVSCQLCTSHSPPAARIPTPKRSKIPKKQANSCHTYNLHCRAHTLYHYGYWCSNAGALYDDIQRRNQAFLVCTVGSVHTLHYVGTVQQSVLRAHDSFAPDTGACRSPEAKFTVG